MLTSASFRSFGAVYRAMHNESKIILACKVISMGADEQEHESITQEIDILKKCNHKNIVKYYGSAFSSSDLWILMEYCAIGYDKVSVCA